MTAKWSRGSPLTVPTGLAGNVVVVPPASGSICSWAEVSLPAASHETDCDTSGVVVGVSTTRDTAATVGTRTVNVVHGLVERLPAASRDWTSKP